MNKKNLFFIFLIYLFICHFYLYSQPLVGGDILKVEFSFLNKSNIPLNNQNIKVVLELTISDKKKIIPYQEEFIVFPQKKAIFDFTYQISISFYGIIKARLIVNKDKKTIYYSSPISFQVGKNYKYYLLKKIQKKYRKELKDWKNFSDNPQKYFKNPSLLPDIKKSLQKLLKSPLIKRTFDREDFYMIKVAVHRINFFLEKNKNSFNQQKMGKSTALALTSNISPSSKNKPEKKEITSPHLKTSFSPLKKNKLLSHKKEITSTSLNLNLKFSFLPQIIRKFSYFSANLPLIIHDKIIQNKYFFLTYLTSSKPITISKAKIEKQEEKVITPKIKKDYQQDVNKLLPKEVTEKRKTINRKKEKKKYFYLTLTLIILFLSFITLINRLKKKDTFNAKLFSKKGKTTSLEKKKKPKKQPIKTNEIDEDDIMSRLDDSLF